MQDITSPISPLGPGRDMFLRAKTASSMFDSRPLSQLTEATEIFDTEFEDEGESDYDERSQKGSFESVSTSIRTSTTIR